MGAVKEGKKDGKENVKAMKEGRKGRERSEGRIESETVKKEGN